MITYEQNDLLPRHFAFLRALTEGVEPQSAWERYLVDDGPTPAGKRMEKAVASLRWLVSMLARRLGRADIAQALVFRRVSSHEASNSGADFDKFVVDSGLEDFSLDEQLWSFQERFGSATCPSPVDARRARHVRRQLAGLRWLEAQSAPSPRDGDLLSLWCPASLCRTLEDRGLVTLGNLRTWITERGDRWYHPLKSIGPVRAARLEAWLSRHGLSVEPVCALHSPMAPPPANERRRRGNGFASARPLSEAATAVRPLEYYLPPADVPRAQDDVMLARTWIRSRVAPAHPSEVTGHGSGASPHRGSFCGSTGLTATQRCYRKEVERLILWSHLIAGSSVLDLDAAQCSQYLNFLQGPAPRQQWCAPRGEQRWSATWRPFEGPLSYGSRRQSLAILRSFFQWLVREGQRADNPWSGLTALLESAVEDAAERQHLGTKLKLLADRAPAPSLEAASLRVRRDALARAVQNRWHLSLRQLSLLTWKSLDNASGFAIVVEPYRQGLRYALGDASADRDAAVFPRLPQAVTLMSSGGAYLAAPGIGPSAFSQDRRRLLRLIERSLESGKTSSRFASL